jgi:uncharacterized protein YndB with AHSA1/START domain
MDIRCRSARSICVREGSGASSAAHPRETFRRFYGEFREIRAPRAHRADGIFEPFPDAPAVNTTVLTEENGKTRVTVTSVYPSKDIRDMVLKTGMEKGAALSYDRLEDVARELADRVV